MPSAAEVGSVEDSGLWSDGAVFSSGLCRFLVVEAGLGGTPRAGCLSVSLQAPGNWGNLGLGGVKFENN